MIDSEYINLEEYEELGKIGEGSFGEVFTIRNKISNQIYAAKISLKSTLNLRKKDKKEMDREIKIISHLNHRSIVTFIGYNPKNFNDEDKPVIVTEYLPNGSLKKLIEIAKKDRAPKEFNFTKKIIILYGIASGMNYLHSRGVLHRDLKPGNILLDIFLYPKICDFGLSKDTLESMSTTNDYKGTFLYMAPEILQSYSYSQKSDVYAFGMTAYELFALQKPFEGQNVVKIIPDVVKGKRPTFPPFVDDSIQFLIKKCWDSSPDKRPSFSEILNFLKARKRQEKLSNKKEFLNYVDYIDNEEELIKPAKIILYPDQAGKNDENEEDFEEEEEIQEEEENDDDDEEEDEEEKIAVSPPPFPMPSKDKKRAPSELYADGIKCKKVKGHMNDAIYFFKLAAKKNNVKSMKELCSIYYEGPQMIKVNYKLAFKYAEFASKKGDVESMIKVAQMYEDGEGVDQNFEKACTFYKMAAEKGDLHSMNKYALMLDSGNGIEADKKEACKFYKMAADSGNKFAMVNFAISLINGEGIEKDINLATSYLKKAESLGDEQAKKQLRRIKLKNDADKGNTNAMISYSKLLINAEKNEKEALKYLRMASKQGNEAAKELYENLLSKMKNTPSSVEGETANADNNNDNAVDQAKNDSANNKEPKAKMVKKESNNQLNRLLVDTLRLHKKSMEYRQALVNHDATKMTLEQNMVNERKVIKSFTELADKGDSTAMLNLGIYYENGYTVVQDQSEALKLYKQSKELGNDEAKERYEQLLSKMNNTQASVEVETANADNNNDNEADQAKNDSANNKEPKAKMVKKESNNQLNRLLVDTLRLHKKSMEYRQALVNHDATKMTLEQNMVNERKVIKSFTELADKGDSTAMLNLGIYYENGYTVVQDQSEALKLYKQSKELGNDEAKERYEQLLSKMNNTQCYVEDDDDDDFN